MIFGSPPTILIVEDDHDQAVILRQNLRQHGFIAQHAESLKAAQKYLSHSQPSLILLDLNLPDGNGRRLLAEIKAMPNPVPVIVLSAVGQEAAHARALHEGADDFIVKPYHLQLLVARITAVLRRLQTQGSQTPLYYFGDLVLDTAKEELRRLTPIQHTEIKINLTANLFALLKAFVSKPNQALSREQIAAITQGRDYQTNTRSIDMQISQLRKCIEPNPRQPIYLHTRWGKGYVFTPAGESTLPPPEQQCLPLGP